MTGILPSRGPYGARTTPTPHCRRTRARARVNDDDNPFFTESDKNHPGNSPKANEGTRTITPPALLLPLQ